MKVYLSFSLVFLKENKLNSKSVIQNINYTPMILFKLCIYFNFPNNQQMSLTKVT